MYSYIVRCTFQCEDPTVVPRWLEWLTQGHIADVIEGGATSGSIFKMDLEPPNEETYEIRYEFPSREAFENYEKNHAPRLREEGLAKFPHELGLKYERRIGSLIEQVAKSDG